MQINGLLEKTSLIRMIDGAQKPVDSVRIGEPCYSEDGSRSQILDIMVGREACGIQLSLINGTVLICTEGLPIQTSEGWKAAVSVKPGDSVGYQEKWGKAYIEVQEVQCKPSGGSENQRKYSGCECLLRRRRRNHREWNCGRGF